ncbi:MAG: ferrous iron transport protein B [Candidatus Eiseniibacteriota bacterium]|nr:MAG: ferrous iron transport protein B [Candidatus Eisenbacteria bacterium]
MDAHSVQLLTDRESSRQPLSVLVGNPNVGKSVIFGLLTGRYVVVSNYPGTTVEVATGHATFGKEKNVLIDTPGVNTLVPMSEDEKVTRDILFNPRLRAVIQIADAKNLQRALVVTLQLAEMGLPVVLALNMHDEAKSRGVSIDAKGLSEFLGVEVVTTVATQKRGIEKLARAAASPGVPGFSVSYADSIERASEDIFALLPETLISKRYIALTVLSGDSSVLGQVAGLGAESRARIVGIANRLQSSYGEPVGYLINRRRISVIERALSQVMVKREGTSRGWAGRLGMLTMHGVWGLPFAAGIVWLMYQLVGRFGAGVLVDFFEGTLFGEYINTFLAQVVEKTVPWEFVRDLLVGHYGVVTMGLTYAIGIVLPIVATFFFAFGILEDSGYLPRLAIMSNRLFKSMGLSGKAILPIVLGLGCATMATLTARVMPTLKERIIVTLLLALAVPCSAQLGVIMGMLGGLSPVAALIWFAVILGVMFLAGALAARVIPGRSSDFLLEIPPLRVPQVGNLLAKTGARIEWYLREALWIFVLGTLVLFLLDRAGALGLIERAAAPVVVRLLSLPSEATEAFIVGFLRRDYGAAGLFMLARRGAMDPVQIVVSLVTITLFIPCFANLLMIIKERGVKVAAWMVVFIVPFSFLVGGVLNFVLRRLKVL